MAAASSLSSRSSDFGIGAKVLPVLGGGAGWPFLARGRGEDLEDGRATRGRGGRRGRPARVTLNLSASFTDTQRALSKAAKELPHSENGA